MIKILKYSIYDLGRSHWTFIYFGFYLLIAGTLLFLGGDVLKAIISLMNIILILIPLISTIFGIMYFYNSRDFIELLVAQPVKRSSIFLGQYLGLSLALSVSFLLGMGIPFLFYGLKDSGQFMNFLSLILTGSFLTFIFTAVAFLIGLFNENKIKGFGLAILFWLFMAVIYDGLFLLSLLMLEAYPIEKLALGMTVFNPIDLSRIFIMLKLDISALMGYTGAIFQDFFGTATGLTITILALGLWVFIPVYGLKLKGNAKDF
ncbi:ABC transporter permease [Flexithrix dorotheae]|uniref:ABC transporter permease n=1 Tax=Flexithrix dorotheae TaxID=70993 RepID=UPI00037B2675|nr:ABC transporter permease subunit [Flexithrix dorotheae]